jgi:hypothetical protein
MKLRIELEQKERREWMRREGMFVFVFDRDLELI